MKTFKALAILLTVIVVFTSCQKNEQPVLPPESSISLNTDEFASGQEKLVGTNFLWAAAQVGFWTLTINTHFALPIYAYKYALQQEPTQVDDNTWLWQYNVDFAFNTYTVKLYGRVDGRTVTWEMYVNDFLWFEGHAKTDGTEGDWIFYDTDSTATIQVDWTFDNRDSTGTAQFTVINDQSDYYGSYIYYGNNLDGLYDCFFNIYNTGDTTSSEIQWNSQTHIGRIKSEKIFSDLIWHCWDDSLNNCVCPTETKLGE